MLVSGSSLSLRTPRYTKKLPLPLSAARRQAEKEDVERRRDWLDVNVHKSWVDSDTAVVLDVGCRGEDARMVAFGTTRGREDVSVYKISSSAHPAMLVNTYVIIETHT